MVNNSFTNISILNNAILNNLRTSENSFEKFLNFKFPNWSSFIKFQRKDNIYYYLGEQLKFSIRLDDSFKKYKHIDLYIYNDIRPYMRVFLSNDFVTKYRYYEYNSWSRNYDVIIGNNFVPIYTIEYFKERERYIDFYFKPGNLFYDKGRFLSYMSSQKSDLKKIWLLGDYKILYDYIIELIDNDIDKLLDEDLFNDTNLIRYILKQKKGDDANFFQNVIKESKIQPEYWSKVLMFIYRLGQFIRYHCNSKEFEHLYVKLNRKYVELFLNCVFPTSCLVGVGSIVLHPYNIVLDPNGKIGNGCLLSNNIVIESDTSSKIGAPIIGDNVSIGYGAIIIGEVEIGDNTQISAGSVTTKSFEKNLK